MNRPYDDMHNSGEEVPEEQSQNDDLNNTGHASIEWEEPTLLYEIRPLLPLLLIPAGSFAFLLFLAIMIPALGLTLPLLPVLAVLYGLYFLLRKRINKPLVWLLRILVVLATAVYVMIPLSLGMFKETKAMYPLKHFVYTHGVNGWENSRPLLPDRMPEICEDYLIITQGQAPTQDYHPSLYLMYRTDTQTLHEYEEWLDSHVIAERFQNTPPDPGEWGLSDEQFENLDEESRRQLNCPRALPQHVYYRLNVTDNLDNAVIYVVNEYYDKGCLLNYETGLVVFWL